MDNTDASRRQVMISALAMAFGTLTSRSLGLVREMAFAAIFPKTITDAWTTAWRLPNLFRRLLGEGSLSVAFIPVYVRLRSQDPSGAAARKFANSFYALLCLVLLCLTTLGTVFPEPLLKFLLHENFEAVPGKLELTIAYARIMFCFIFFVSLYAYFMAILNALGKFGWAAMAPTFFNVAMIVSTFFPGPLLGLPGASLAWGVVVGGILQLVVLIPLLVRNGVLPRFEFHFRQPEIWKVLRAMGPGLLGTGLLQITTLVNLRFASSLGEGAISYLYWSDRLLELPLSLVSVSLGAALLPSLSKSWAEGKRNEMMRTLRQTLRVNLYLALPSAVGLFILAKLIVQVLFERGKFEAVDTSATSLVVQISALTLLTASTVRVLVPAYYAISNTWLPSAAAGVGLLGHLILAPILMAKWGIGGLVFSTVLSGAINLLVLVIFFRKFLGDFGIKEFGNGLWKFAIVSCLLAVICWSGSDLASNSSGVLARLFILAATIVCAGAVYFGSSSLLKIPEVQSLRRRR